MGACLGFFPRTWRRVAGQSTNLSALQSVDTYDRDRDGYASGRFPSKNNQTKSPASFWPCSLGKCEEIPLFAHVATNAQSISHMYVRTRPSAFPAVLVDALLTLAGWGGEVGWGGVEK